MYIYNVTVNLDDSIHKEWLDWIKPHIKEVLASKRFVSAKLTKVILEDKSENTYSIQYTAKTREDLDIYYAIDAPKLRSEGLAKFADKMLAFRTELKIIEEF